MFCFIRAYGFRCGRVLDRLCMFFWRRETFFFKIFDYFYILFWKKEKVRFKEEFIFRRRNK